MAVKAYLALGSNMGERVKFLQRAVEALQATDGIKVTDVSAIYETEPVGYVDQPAFLNMVVAIETTLQPEQLLSDALAIEQRLDRVRTIRNGPRTIDIDVLLYGAESIQLPHLQIPHPAMQERAFVLVPLRDVYDAGELLLHGKTIEEWIVQANDLKGVRRWGTLDWATGSDPSAN